MRFVSVYKKDIFAAALIGFIVGVSLIFIFKNIELEVPFIGFAPLVLSFLSVIGIAIAAWIGKKVPVLFQAAKFALVGVLNTMIDLGVLNVLMFASGIAGGLYFSLFKAVSFLLGVTNSYFWNKFWTFKSKKEVRAIEFIEFVAIAGVGFIINVGVASFIVNTIEPQFGMGERVWANAGAIMAALSGMSWNFLGYKYIVFRKKDKKLDGEKAS